MTKAEKVVWTEGMFLRPHHFQRTESYLLTTFVSGGLAAIVSLGLSRP